MCVAGVLKGCDKRDVMSTSRSRRFFLDPDNTSSMSESGRVRLGDIRCDFDDFLNVRGGRGRGVALKAKTLERGEEEVVKSMVTTREIPL